MAELDICSVQRSQCVCFGRLVCCALRLLSFCRCPHGRSPAPTRRARRSSRCTFRDKATCEVHSAARRCPCLHSPTPSRPHAALWAPLPHSQHLSSDSTTQRGLVNLSQRCPRLAHGSWCSTYGGRGGRMSGEPVHMYRCWLRCSHCPWRTFL